MDRWLVGIARTLAGIVRDLDAIAATGGLENARSALQEGARRRAIYRLEGIGEGDEATVPILTRRGA